MVTTSSFLCDNTESGQCDSGRRRKRNLTVVWDKFTDEVLMLDRDQADRKLEDITSC